MKYENSYVYYAKMNLPLKWNNNDKIQNLNGEVVIRKIHNVIESFCLIFKLQNICF